MNTEFLARQGKHLQTTPTFFFIKNGSTPGVSSFVSKQCTQWKTSRLRIQFYSRNVCIEACLDQTSRENGCYAIFSDSWSSLPALKSGKNSKNKVAGFLDMVVIGNEKADNAVKESSINRSNPTLGRAVPHTEMTRQIRRATVQLSS